MTSNLQPSPAEFRDLSTRGNLIPVFAELIADAESPVSAFHKLADGSDYAFLFESVEKHDQAGRYSFIGVDQRVSFESRGPHIRIVEDGVAREFATTSDPLADLETLMQRYRYVPSPALADARFAGGAVGYLSYDLVRFFEPTVSTSPPDDLGLPESFFTITGTLLIFDHRTRRLRIVANAHVNGDPDAAYQRAAAVIARTIAKLNEPARLPMLPIAPAPELSAPVGNTTREEYMKMVSDGQEFIRAGDIFQFVPSQRFETDYTGDPLTLYRTLRFVNPSPYMFCMKFAGRFALVGSSPEVHVRAIDGRIEIRPIAGTRRRGATPEEDIALEAELLADPKERAEHLMLLDLGRNDVGRVAAIGTVKVTAQFRIERYSQVMHIASEVRGRLRAGLTALDALQAGFPAGTLSGAPKVRAMEIIEELEPSRRGLYAGGLGYFGVDGNMDICIALRTALVKDGTLHVQAGAGVVADSDPRAEHEECIQKAKALFRAAEEAVRFAAGGR